MQCPVVHYNHWPEKAMEQKYLMSKPGSRDKAFGYGGTTTPFGPLPNVANKLASGVLKNSDLGRTRMFKQ